LNSFYGESKLKRVYLILLLILPSLEVSAQPIVTDIYTVQQDTSFIGKNVAILGIVTARTGIFDLNRTYMEDPNGGPWSGIALWDETGGLFAEEGDQLRAIGKVSERNGLTEILISSYWIFSKGNPIPDAENVNTFDISAVSSIAESYESVLVNISNLSVVNDSLGDGEWLVDDGSGACLIDDESDNFTYKVPAVGTDISAITGILNYTNSNFKLEPRYRSDIMDGDTSSIYTIQQVQQNLTLIGDTVTVTGIVTASTGIFHPGKTFIEDQKGGAYSGILIWDSTATLYANEGDKVRVTGEVFEDDGMTEILIDSYEIISTGNPLPEIEMVLTGDISSDAQNAALAEIYEGVLVRVNDVYISDNNLGNGEWEVNNIEGACDGLRGLCRIDDDAENLFYEVPSTGTPLSSITGIFVYSDNNFKLEPRYLSDINEGATFPIGDTLTIIQRPLLNIPAILQPGDTLDIICDLLQSPSSWSASLKHQDHLVTLTPLGQEFDEDNELWLLRAIIPDIILSELYDLKLEIPGENTDIEKNAVHIIPGYKDDFYFIHITDTHLPTSNYCRDSYYQQDSSNVEDLREVMKDISLINPAFVLHTGDLIHEGELEDYLHNRYYSKTKRILSEFEVPLYLVAGNHDLGGWSDTPMSDGTARRNWWRFFGWKSLDNSSGINPPFTQDYTFEYGDCHFIGLESYLNYDWWRSEIYGGASFIPSQIAWLEQELSMIDESELKILFYHYDFDTELNLEELGIDLALWGHTHGDYGSLDTYPLNIGTAACGGGRRAYRLIRVSGDSIIPAPTLNAGGSGNNLKIEYEPANNGLNYIVTAQVSNNLNEQFEHARFRFIMPLDGINPEITGGEIVQIDNSGSNIVYYVDLDIPPNSSQSVKLSVYSPGVGPFAQNCTIDGSFLVPGKDTLSMETKIVNPDSQGVLVNSIIESTDLSVMDTVGMYDDGSHGDSIAGDGLYSGYWPAPLGEKEYKIHIRTITLDSVYDNLLSDAAYFTTIGPVKFDSIYIAQNVGNLFRIRLILRNEGLITSASNINAEIKISNSTISIEDNYRFFDDIDPGQTAQSASFYNLVTSNPPDSINIDVDIFSNDKLFWRDSFSLSFVALELSETDNTVPREFALQQNYPNPFNPITTIEFSLPTTEFVNLRVYDSVGQEVAILLNRRVGPGNYKFDWNASGFASGVYYYKIEAGDYTQSRKLILIK